MLFKKIHVLLFGALICLTSAFSSKYLDSGNADFDKLLKQLRQISTNTSMLDPLQLPDIVDNKHKYQSIKVTGMSNIYRSKDIIFKPEPGTRPTIAEITISTVNVTADCSTKLLFFDVHADASFVFEDLPITLLLSSEEDGIKVSLIRIGREENYYIRYNGWLMLGSLNVALKESLQSAREVVIEALEQAFPKAFEHDLNEVISDLRNKT